MNGRESMPALQGKTAVVTGGTRGIGRAISVRLALEGARVLLTGTDERRARAAAAEVAELTGGEVIGTRCDVADESSVLELASLVRAEFEHVDALVNNAGIAVRNAIPDITAAEWRQFSLVTVGRLIARAALRREESRGGHSRTDFPERDDLHWRRHAFDQRASR